MSGPRVGNLSPRSWFHWLIPNSIAYTELYLTLAMIFRRFNLRLFETYRERDVDIQRDCFLGEPDLKTQGVRVQIVEMVKVKWAHVDGI